MSAKTDLFLKSIVKQVEFEVDKKNPRLDNKARNAMIRLKLEEVAKNLVKFIFHGPAA